MWRTILRTSGSSASPPTQGWTAHRTTIPPPMEGPTAHFPYAAVIRPCDPTSARTGLLMRHKCRSLEAFLIRSAKWFAIPCEPRRPDAVVPSRGSSMMCVAASLLFFPSLP